MEEEAGTTQETEAPEKEQETPQLPEQYQYNSNRHSISNKFRRIRMVSHPNMAEDNQCHNTGNRHNSLMDNRNMGYRILIFLMLEKLGKWWNRGCRTTRCNANSRRHKDFNMMLKMLS
jgi:hypothetical protein